VKKTLVTPSSLISACPFSAMLFVSIEAERVPPHA
jgi:hypothetical protein